MVGWKRERRALQSVLVQILYQFAVLNRALLKTMSDSDDDEPPMLVELNEPNGTESKEAEPSKSAPVPTSTEEAKPCPVTILSGFLGGS